MRLPHTLTSGEGDPMSSPSEESEREPKGVVTIPFSRVLVARFASGRPAMPSPLLPRCAEPVRRP